MAATYDPTLPAALDRVRFALGDTDTGAPLAEDETYAAALTLYSETEATAVMAEALAARIAQEPDSFSSGDLSLSWRDRVKTLLAVAERARSAATVTAGSTAGSLLASRGDELDSEYLRDAGALVWWTT